MRKFSSYGPVDTSLHYYTPRTELINEICTQLLGEDPTKTGHYITIWAPRQTGKTWTTNQVLYHLIEEQPDFDTVKLNLQDLEDQETPLGVYKSIVARLRENLGYSFPVPESQEDFVACFSQKSLPKPLILILDEFDALQKPALHGVVSAFRNIYNSRLQETEKKTGEKTYLLHGIALIGVRSVLGIENTSGSPFNIQRSVHIPNLTWEEVEGIFQWYEKESGQRIVPEVIERVYYEMQGQPGLTCWMGELLTEVYNRNQPEITMYDFNGAYSAAIEALPNNNILNIVSKAKQEEYKHTVLDMYRTARKSLFRYDDPATNFLYMNGVVDRETVQEDTGKRTHYLKFPSPFVQKRLFNYFANELFRGMDHLYDPLADLSNVITDTTLDLVGVLRYYEAYLQENRSWLLKESPRRKTDERIYEAVYHFNFYMYLSRFMHSYHSHVIPEFPTGNGKIDLFIEHGCRAYGLEVKSFVNRREFQDAKEQAAKYAHTLNVQEIWLAVFIEQIDDTNRQALEKTYIDPTYNTTVHPIIVNIGSTKL